MKQSTRILPLLAIALILLTGAAPSKTRTIDIPAKPVAKTVGSNLDAILTDINTSFRKTVKHANADLKFEIFFSSSHRVGELAVVVCRPPNDMPAFTLLFGKEDREDGGNVWVMLPDIFEAAR